jgi:hypothetical protein
MTPKPIPLPPLSREDRMRAWLARNAPIATAQAAQKTQAKKPA